MDRSTRFWHIAERGLAVQNPVAAPDIRRMGRVARLQATDRVLDVGCGKGGPALILVRQSGCSVVGIDRSELFIERARRRFLRAGLEGRARFVQQDARDADEAGGFTMGICLGATFVLGGLEKTVRWLRERVVPGGFILVGECFIQADAPARDGIPDGFADLPATIERFEAGGLRLHGLHGARREDWDRYESTIWANIERYVDTHPLDADNEYFLERKSRMQADYLGWERDRLGWAMFLGRRA